MTEAIATPRVDSAVLRKFDIGESEYSLYPTPSRFIEAFGAKEYESWLRKRGIGGFGRSLTLYVDAPCIDDTQLSQSVRHNAVLDNEVSKNHGTWSRYLEYLKQEARLLSGLLDDHSLAQIHWGHDLSVCLDDAELRDLHQALAHDFDETTQTEHSIDVDPHNVTGNRIATLASLGFNRISLGSTDFRLQEKARLDRTQIDASSEAVVKAARACGFNSINFNLYYGLPEQTVMSFNHALQKVIALSPERIAVINYAHLPRTSGLRRRTDGFDLQDIDMRIQLFSLAALRLFEAGYVHLGLDYFAKPDDALAIAQRQGRLHLNCRGYLTQPDCDLLGLGLSAISMVGPTYSQNARTLNEYYEHLDDDQLPVMRGIELTADDLARRTVMHALMCHFEVAFESVEIAYLLDFRKYFANELQDLAVFVDAGLVQIDDKWLAITDRGRYVVRAICQVFDRYWREGRKRASFSKVL